MVEAASSIQAYKHTLGFPLVSGIEIKLDSIQKESIVIIKVPIIQGHSFVSNVHF